MLIAIRLWKQPMSCDKYNDYALYNKYLIIGKEGIQLWCNYVLLQVSDIHPQRRKLCLSCSASSRLKHCWCWIWNKTTLSCPQYMMGMISFICYVYAKHSVWKLWQDASVYTILVMICTFKHPNFWFTVHK